MRHCRCVGLPASLTASLRLVITAGEVGGRGRRSSREWWCWSGSRSGNGAVQPITRRLTVHRKPGFRWGTVFVTLVNFAMFGLFFTVPQYYQAVLGVDALGSGIRLLPLIGGLIVGARSGDMLLRKAGARSALGGRLRAAGARTGARRAHFGRVVVLVRRNMDRARRRRNGVGDAGGDGCRDRRAVGRAGGHRIGDDSGVPSGGRHHRGRHPGHGAGDAYRSGLGGLDVEPFRDGVAMGVAAAKSVGDAGSSRTCSRRSCPG